MAEQLSSNEVLKQTIANGELNLTTPGWNLSGLQMAHTKNYADVTGLGYQRRYEEDDSSDWTLAYQVGHTDETDYLWDEPGREQSTKRYPFGENTGADFKEGTAICEYVEFSRQGRKLHISYSGMANSALVTKQVA